MKVVAMFVFFERLVWLIWCIVEREQSFWFIVQGLGFSLYFWFFKFFIIVFDFFRYIVIDDVLDGREVQVFGGYVRSYQNIFFVFSECFNGFGSFFLVWGGLGRSCQSNSRRLGSSGRLVRQGKGLGEGLMVVGFMLTRVLF